MDSHDDKKDRILEKKIKLYEITKLEYVEHIKLRNNVMAAYLGVVGLLFGATFSMKDPKYEILISIPLISFGAAFIIAQHNMVIVSIGKYFKELFADCSSNNLAIWEYSNALEEYWPCAVLFTTLGYGLCLTLPSIISYIIIREMSEKSFYHSHLFKIFFIMIIGATAIVVSFSGLWRLMVYLGLFGKKKNRKSVSR